MVVARNADVATDTFADVLDTAFFNLFGQERIRDRWARSSDHVEPPVVDQ